MIKTILMVGAIGLAILILVPLAILVGSDMRPHKLVAKLPNSQNPIASVVPLSIAQVRARLDQKLDGGAKVQIKSGWMNINRPDLGPQFADTSVISNEDGGIDFRFRYTETGMSSDAPISAGPLDLETQDPGLPAYLKLPVSGRQHDLFFQVLVPSQNNPSIQWTTPDFPHDGKLLPYSSSYFLHLEALAPEETKLTVLGYDATVIKGERWSVLGDMFFGPPHRIDNVLSVPPAPADKRAMLDNILRFLK